MTTPLVAAALAAGMFRFLTPTPGPAPVETGVELAAPPVLLWSTALEGRPPESAVESEPASPVVDGDRIYVGFSGVQGLLVLDRHDGRTLGVLPAQGSVASAPVVSAERVWFTDDAGYTWAYRRPAPGRFRTPEPLWSHYSGAPILSSPKVVDGVVYVANVGELVYALDAGTGDLRWRHAHRLDPTRGAALELFGAPSPVVQDGFVYVGFSDGFLAALARDTGEEQWRTSVGEGTYPDLIAAPLPVGDAVIAGGFSEPLVSVDPSTRAVRWRIEAGTAAPLALGGDRVWQGGADGILRGIDPRTGEVVVSWTSPVGGTLTEPLLTPAGVLVGSAVGSIYLVDPASGATRWTFDPDFLLAGVTGRPTVDGDRVYFLSNAGRLYALRGPSTLTDTADSWLPASRAYRTRPTPRR